MIMHGVLEPYRVHKRPIDAHAQGCLSTASSLLLRTPRHQGRTTATAAMALFVAAFTGGSGVIKVNEGGSKPHWSLELSLVSQAVLLSIEV